MSKKYYLNGGLHREDGPAVIIYYLSGELRAEKYYVNNMPHREDGPTIIWYRLSGEVEHKVYFLNGKKATKEEVDYIKYSKQFDEDVEEALSDAEV